MTNTAYSFIFLPLLPSTRSHSCNVWQKYMISTRKMLQSTSKSSTRKYLLIAIMEEYISRLSAIVMQLVREEYFSVFENSIETAHFGIAYWFFSPAENENINFISLLKLSLWNTKFNFLNDIKNPIALPLPLFLFGGEGKNCIFRGKHFSIPVWGPYFCDVFSRSE